MQSHRMSGIRAGSANRFPSTHEKVISTEAAHGIIVSSAVEKSAFLPPAFANPHRALVFAPALAVIVAVAVRIRAGAFSPTLKPSREAATGSAQGSSEAPGEKRLILLHLFALTFIFRSFLPKNRMSSP